MSLRNFKTKLKMKREDFWKYISLSHKNSKDNNEFINYLTNVLAQKTNEEIFDFDIITNELMCESYNEKLWCASYLVNGEMASWSFDFFRLWLISQGKKIYDSIIKNQDALSKYINIPFKKHFLTNYFENENFAFIAPYAFSQKNLLHDDFKNLDDTDDNFIVYDKAIFQENLLDNYFEKLNNYKQKIGYKNKKYPQIKFHWCIQFPSSMKEVCPTLFETMYLE